MVQERSVQGHVHRAPTGMIIEGLVEQKLQSELKYLK